MLTEKSYIILDTHAIMELFTELGDRSIGRRIIEIIKIRCHSLIIPDIVSELRVHLQVCPLNLIEALRSLLRGKFISLDRPPKAPQKILKKIEKYLWKIGCDKGDIVIAKVAYKRAKEHSILIVSNDKCFHNALPKLCKLCKHRVEVVDVERFLEIINFKEQ